MLTKLHVLALRYVNAGVVLDCIKFRGVSMIPCVNRQDKEMRSNSLQKVNQYNKTYHYELNNKKHLMKCAELSDNINKNFRLCKGKIYI